MMSRRLAAFLLSLVLLAACGNSLRSKEKVQQAILERLSTHSGLDMNALDVNTTSVSFKNNMAYATVAFHPKGDTSVNSGMLMNYTLKAQNGKWVVVNVSDSQGHGLAGHSPAGGDQLPPGHPPLDQMNPQASPGTGSSGQQK
jgi:hypothetical protein